MRALAASLQVKTASLYNYVSGRGVAAVCRRAPRVVCADYADGGVSGGAVLAGAGGHHVGAGGANALAARVSCGGARFHRAGGGRIFSHFPVDAEVSFQLAVQCCVQGIVRAEQEISG